jgi:hypothetical protein
MMGPMPGFSYHVPVLALFSLALMHEMNILKSEENIKSGGKYEDPGA